LFAIDILHQLHKLKPAPKMDDGKQDQETPEIPKQAGEHDCYKKQRR
jgi:hypothetical protein